MFLIKNININGGTIYISTKKDKYYSISLHDSRVSKLLPLASSSSSKIKKNIRYFEKYFIICVICMIICAIGALTPLVLGYSFDEVFLVGFGFLELAATTLAISSKLYIKWLKKYSINNEYWQEILSIIENKENIDINNKVNEKKYTNYTNNTYNYQKVDVAQTNYNRIDDNHTYSYSKNQIIQDYPQKDKVKTYKRY